MMDWVVGRFEGLPEISHSILIPPGTSRNELANQFALVRNNDDLFYLSWTSHLHEWRQFKNLKFLTSKIDMFNPTSLEKILRYLFLKCLKIYLFIHHGSRNFDIYLSEMTGNVIYHPPWLEKIF